MNKILINGINSFNNFFSQAIEYNHKNPSFKPTFKNGINIGNYLQISGDNIPFQSLEVIPNEEMINIVANNMLAIDNDQIYFEIVIRNDGTALLIAKYNQIIGSRWISYIDTDTIPLLKEKGE